MFVHYHGLTQERWNQQRRLVTLPVGARAASHAAKDLTVHAASFLLPFPYILRKAGCWTLLLMVRLVRTKYQQYKLDTQRLSHWLGKSGWEYGFPLASFERSTQPRDEEEDARTAAQAKKEGASEGEKEGAKADWWSY